MIFVSRFYNSRVQGVSGKNKQPAQTAWRGAQCSYIGCISLKPALLVGILWCYHHESYNKTKFRV